MAEVSEMIERVARAMAENAGFAWEACAQSQWRSDARAGIMAMTESTNEMHKAMCECYDSPVCIWMTGIKHALQ